MLHPINRMIRKSVPGFVACLVAFAGLAYGQESAKTKQAAPNRVPATAQAGQSQAMMFPTGDRASSVVMVEAMSPPSVTVGRDYEYTIRVTNISKNLTLDKVAVSQLLSEGFAIESSEPKTSDSDGSSANWSLGSLKPGESKSIKAVGLGDKEGTVNACISVDYVPSLCLATEFTKPAIQVVKTAAETVDICRPLQIRYAVKNTGTGVARGITVTDDLPDGLTVDGQAKVTHQVGDLQPGQTEEFTVQAVAAKTGTYRSRAVANGAEDLTAQSNPAMTKVVMANLELALNGPPAQNLAQPIVYQAVVKNVGDAPAINATLNVDVDNQARVLRMSQSAPGDVRPSESGGTISWNFGNLEPGGERTVSFTVQGRGSETLEHTAIATSVCDGEMAKDMTKSKTVTTEILTFPALLLEMVDEVDPVKVGDEEKYDIVVRNQGSGADQNVQIKLMVPDQFEFVSASGTTKATADGQTVTFEPVPSLAPKAKVGWTIRLKAVKDGDVRTEVQLTSDYLQTPLPEQEPTRVID